MIHTGMLTPGERSIGRKWQAATETLCQRELPYDIDSLESPSDGSVFFSNRRGNIVPALFAKVKRHVVFLTAVILD